MRVYICYAQADAAVYQELTLALQAAGVEVVGDSYPTSPGPGRAATPTRPLRYTTGAPLTGGGSVSRPLDGPDLWTCDAFIVLLSQVTLHSARARSETRRFHEIRLGEPQRRLLPLVIQPIEEADLWPFLQDYPLIEATQGEAWSPQSMGLGALQGLGGVAQGSVAAGQPLSALTAYNGRRAVVAPPPRRTAKRPLLIVALALMGVALIGTVSLAWLHNTSGNAHPIGTASHPTLPASTVTFISVQTATTAPTARPTNTTHPTARPQPTATATATPLPSVEAVFVKSDGATEGTWEGAYGSQGYAIAQFSEQLPNGIQMTVANNSLYTWSGSTGDGRALQKPGATDRIASCWYSGASFTIDITITDGKTHQLALYLLDWDRLGRQEILTITDPATGATLDSRSATRFGSGEYFVWNVRGHITIQVKNLTKTNNAVVSGVFFA